MPTAITPHLLIIRRILFLFSILCICSFSSAQSSNLWDVTQTTTDNSLIQDKVVGPAASDNDQLASMAQQLNALVANSANSNMSIQAYQEAVANITENTTNADTRWYNQMFGIFVQAGLPTLWLNLRYALVCLATLFLSLTFFNQMRQGRVDLVDIFFRCLAFCIFWGGADPLFRELYFLQQNLPKQMMGLSTPSSSNWETALRTKRVMAEARKAVIMDVLKWVKDPNNGVLTTIDTRPAFESSEKVEMDPNDARYQGGPSHADRFDLADIMVDLVYSGTTNGQDTIINGTGGDLTIKGMNTPASNAAITSSYSMVPTYGYGAPVAPIIVPTTNVTYANVTIKALENSAVNFGLAEAKDGFSAAEPVFPSLSYAKYKELNVDNNNAGKSTHDPSNSIHLSIALNSALAYLGGVDSKTTKDGNKTKYELRAHSPLGQLFIDRINQLDHSVGTPPEDSEFLTKAVEGHVNALTAMGIIPKAVTIIKSAGTADRDKITVKLGTYIIPDPANKTQTKLVSGSDAWCATGQETRRMLNQNGTPGSIESKMDTDSPNWLVRQIVSLFTIINKVINSGVLMVFTLFYALLFQVQFFIMMVMTPFIFSDKLETAFRGQVKALLYIVITPGIGGLALGLWTTFMSALVSGTVGKLLASGGAAAFALAGAFSSVTYGASLAFILINIVGSIMIAKNIRGWTEKVISGASIAGDIVKTGATAMVSGAIGGAAFGGAIFKGMGAGMGNGGIGNFASNAGAIADKGHSLVESAKGIMNDPSQIGRGRSQIPNVAAEASAQNKSEVEKKTVGSTATKDTALAGDLSTLSIAQQTSVAKGMAGLRTNSAYINGTDAQQQEAVAQVLKKAGVKDPQALAGRIVSADRQDISHNNAIATAEQQSANARAFGNSDQLRHTTAAKAAVEAEKKYSGEDKKSQRQAAIEESLVQQGMPPKQAKALADKYADHKEGDPLKQSGFGKYADFRRANTALLTGNMAVEDYKEVAGVKMVGNLATRPIAELIHKSGVFHTKLPDDLQRHGGAPQYERRALVRATVEVAQKMASGVGQIASSGPMSAIADEFLIPKNLHVTHVVGGAIGGVNASWKASQTNFDNMHTLLQKAPAKR